ncbi:hypothetical protein M758_12G133200 [Ceratodon purpureus]|nr:hypothetical protein M758_12G133200 [Ceratodon purpureus]
MGFKTLAFTFLVSRFFLATTMLVYAQNDGRVDRGRFLCPSYIYAFGDSFTDTGNLQAVMPERELKYPYGESYCFPDRPKERTRFSDGRLVIDFITQAFNFPFIEPYLRHFDDEAYKRGVNFAISSGTATATYSAPGTAFFWERETIDYIEFRTNHTGPLYDAPSALHIIPEIGGNDFTYAYIAGQTPETAIVTVVPLILEAVNANLEQYYASGARNIAIFNIPPTGCTSVILTLFAGRGPYDEFGCLINYNAANQAYNTLLNATIYQYRERWPDANLFLFDYYGATYEVIQNAEKYGFMKEMLTKACCGCCGPYNYNPLVLCGEAGFVPDPNGGPDVFVNVTKACPDPDRYLIWDGQHSTEAFYRIMAGFFLTGQFVDGPREFSNWKELCNLDFTQWFNNGNRRLCDNFFDDFAATSVDDFAATGAVDSAATSAVDFAATSAVNLATSAVDFAATSNVDFAAAPPGSP